MARDFFYVATISYLSCFLTAAHACDKTHKSMTTVDAKEQRNVLCQKNDDCALVKTNCCGCNEGGKQKAITKSLVGEYIKTLTTQCSEMACIQMISNDPSCKMKPLCRDGQCVLQ